uniref:Rho-GAP domain-containing protein n=1 Tax=Oryza brachyantha TaxID=4533 RepID=J3LFV2_ORYBR
MAPSQIRFGHQIPFPSPDTDDEEEEDDEDDEVEEEEDEDEDEEEEYEEEAEGEVPVSSPLMLPAARGGGGGGGGGGVSVVETVAAALRRSLLLCSSVRAAEDEGSAAAAASAAAMGMQIGRPTDVRHVSHVTFDRFVGFLGLPADLEPDVPRPAPSASVSVFGVSPTSMQCSYDSRGNSVPTILLTMQRKLYQLGGLQAEGIFRINADNSQELHVREQLNMGVVPDGVDMHCLTGLIKAWFRELPSGVLDSLTPEQVMHCNTEEECALLASTLPPVEAALLDWAINLMADVVEHENYNKMNARNIAMVFAPNMTQMADPLTALIHAVQVMNFLKTLILKTVKGREETATPASAFPSSSGSPSDKDESQPLEHLDRPTVCSSQQNNDCPMISGATLDHFLFKAEALHHNDAQGSAGRPKKRDNKDHGLPKKRDNKDHDNGSREFSPVDSDSSSETNSSTSKFSNDNVEGLFDRFKFRKGVGRLCRHPVFQLSRSMKKSGEAGQACV